MKLLVNRAHSHNSSAHDVSFLLRLQVRNLYDFHFQPSRNVQFLEHGYEPCEQHPLALVFHRCVFPLKNRTLHNQHGSGDLHNDVQLLSFSFDTSICKMETNGLRYLRVVAGAEKLSAKPKPTTRQVHAVFYRLQIPRA